MSISKIGNAIIYIEENGELTPFIVADTNYRKDAVLLVRKNVLPGLMRFNEYFSCYENSEIDRYLSENYVNELSDIKDYLVPVSIDITAQSSLGLTGKDVVQIERYAFLLSYTELGLGESPTVAREGKAISYFKKAENRLATDSVGEPASFFMRTPNTYYDSMVYSLAEDGVIGNVNASDQNGIRPAICVSSDVPVTRYEDAGENAYVISK